MKLLTFAIPCYNSEAYMEKCIESLLPGGDDVEILIVDDSTYWARTTRSSNSAKSCNTLMEPGNRTITIH